MMRMIPQSIKSKWWYSRLHPSSVFNWLRSSRTTFSDIYANNKWGGKPGVFYSGSGSRGAPVDEYASLVIKFVTDQAPARVLDLGCGDFFVGKKIAEACSSYIGVDVVPDIIEHHKKEYSSSRVEFHCLDIVKDDLPEADICLVRQVFQHLSNKQIKVVLDKLARYRYVIVTEHFPDMNDLVDYNFDKAPGVGTRVAFGSAVNLSHPPFSIEITEVLALPAPQREDGVEDAYTRGTIRTFLIDRTRDR